MFILLAFMFTGQACTQTPSRSSKDPVTATTEDPVLNAAEFHAAIEQGDALLIDVRTPHEYASGHIPGSVNLDWTAPDYEEKFASLDPDKPLLVYCAIGGRSDQAREYLQGKGYQVRELEDGIAGWKNAGLPLERP